MTAQSILLIEDQQTFAAPIIQGLTKEGYRVDHAKNGRRGLLMALRNTYDAVVLDYRLPGIDGLSLLGPLRHVKATLPVMMMTATHGPQFEWQSREAGANDFLTKPFSFNELLKRLKAIMPIDHAAPRRSNKNNRLQLGALHIDYKLQIVRFKKRLLALDKNEYRVLELLLRHAEQVVSRSQVKDILELQHASLANDVIEGTIVSLRMLLEEDVAGLSKGDVAIESSINGVAFRLVEL